MPLSASGPRWPQSGGVVGQTSGARRSAHPIGLGSGFRRIGTKLLLDVAPAPCSFYLSVLTAVNAGLLSARCGIPDPLLKRSSPR